MLRFKPIVLVSTFVALCAFVMSMLPNVVTAQAGTPAWDVYAVKFLCGRFSGAQGPPPNGPVEGPVKPGNYLTAINVHNPNHHETGVAFRKKAVMLYRADKPPAPEAPARPHPFLDTTLGRDYGLEIDCYDIRTVLLKGPVPPAAPPAPTFIKGWVVIEVRGGQLGQLDPLPLDVTAVYTSHGYVKGAGGVLVAEGFSEDVETILPKRVR